MCQRLTCTCACQETNVYTNRLQLAPTGCSSNSKVWISIGPSVTTGSAEKLYVSRRHACTCPDLVRVRVRVGVRVGVGVGVRVRVRVRDRG